MPVPGQLGLQPEPARTPLPAGSSPGPWKMGESGVPKDGVYKYVGSKTQRGPEARGVQEGWGLKGLI